ncbi:DUF7344 domain-containing protein [Halalkalicoccus ordinarius]
MSTADAKRSSSDETGSETPSRASSLSKDDTFHILQNERRRRVLRYLSDAEGPVDMRDIAEQVAAWEHDTTVQQLTSDQRQRVYIALYQSHLPKLADFGLITYNRSRGVVERTPLADQIAWYLDDENGTEESTGARDDWVRYYVGVTVLSLLLIGVVWLGVVPSTLLSNVGLAVVITLLYAAVTAAMAGLPTGT